ncbi:alpha/beta hydrolase fold domain-containing protein [Streptococcus hillyeri]
MKKSLKSAMLLAGLALTLSYHSPVNASDRSWKSWFIEQYFWLKRDKSYYSQQSDISFQNYLDACREQSDKPYQLDQASVNGELKQETLYDMQVFTWNDKNDSNQKTILYLAGGSYLNNPTSYHISMLRNLSIALDAKIVLPIYPKAPRYSYDYAIPRLLNLYDDILKKTNHLILMGDSAGGGLALGLAHALKHETNHLQQPTQIVLLSPWLDVTMSHSEISQYENSDPILSSWGLKRVGELWAKNPDNTDHIYVSPKNGPTQHLAPIAILTGTRDIFYPDIRDYAKTLKETATSKIIYIEKTGMNHVYPIYPIPEATEAQDQIVKIINGTYPY